MTKKCCCADDTICYKLTECESSTTCHEDGIYVTIPAWNYIEEVLFNNPPYGFPVVFWIHDGCCVYADATTDDTEYIISDVLALDDALLLYSKTEPPSGTTIQDVYVFDTDDGCDDELCEIATGACCVNPPRGGWQCEDDKTLEECEALASGVEYKWGGRNSECCDDSPCEDDCFCCPDDPDPNCGEKHGLCLCRPNSDGVNEPTFCEDGASSSECSSTYSLSLTIPSAELFTWIDCTQISPWLNTCQNHCDDCGFGDCCSGGTVGGRTFSTTLTETATDSGSWVSPDETGDGHPNPPVGEWTWGGYADQQMRKMIECPMLGCTDGNCQQTCDDSPCQGEANLNCPCCHAAKLMTYWYRVSVEPTNLIDICDCENSPDDPYGEYFAKCCDAPCCVWNVQISMVVGILQCNTFNDPDYDPTIWDNQTVDMGNWFVRTNGCSCPVLNSSNAHWNPLTPSNYDFDSSFPWQSPWAGERFWLDCNPCLPCTYMSKYGGFSGGWKVNAEEFFSGVNWSIT